VAVAVAVAVALAVAVAVAVALAVTDYVTKTAMTTRAFSAEQTRGRSMQ
jgi:hypothetical protein